MTDVYSFEYVFQHDASAADGVAPVHATPDSRALLQQLCTCAAICIRRRLMWYAIVLSKPMTHHALYRQMCELNQGRVTGMSAQCR